MEYLIIAFRSRASVVAFYQLLKQRGISAEIVNTPKEAMVGCGLSVKSSLKYLPTIRMLASSSGYKNFAGIFLVKVIAGKRYVKLI